MSNVNSVVISGNLTRDPELKHLPSGTTVTDIGLANNRQYKTAEGEYAEKVCFVDVSVFGGFGELVGRKLRKGDSVTIQGRLEFDQWEKDGEKRSKHKIVADQIDSEGFFRSKEEDNVPAASNPTDPAPAETKAELPSDDDIPF